MNRECHGCSGQGWVDSRYSGVVICPVCDGNGVVMFVDTDYSIHESLVQCVEQFADENNLTGSIRVLYYPDNLGKPPDFEEEM